ncbi:MAG: type IX secretion system membrane protein PorP/SprF [Bacteroidetes bacterium]|nr:type IX secretion system membrane protein PorP/SprF [Bacteroidota bacterium]
MPRIALLFFLTAISVTGWAQQTPVYSQYYFNELVINPAYAGSHVQFSATSMYRNQWVNFPGSPKTYLFSAHSSFLKDKMGLGIMINADNIGSYSNKNLYFSYSYFLKFPQSKLSFGLQAGFDFIGADFSKLDLQNPDLSFIPINSFKPNIGAGIYYKRKNFFAGFSVPMLINNKVDYRDANAVANQIKQARYYFLRMGGIFPINQMKTVQFNPSILLRSQEGQPLALDLNAAFVFYEVCSAGVSYRTVDAFITFVELKLSEKIHVAYSYDWTTSNLNAFSNGTHEFMINYRTRIRSLHKNLECPSYYGSN